MKNLALIILTVIIQDWNLNYYVPTNNNAKNLKFIQKFLQEETTDITVSYNGPLLSCQGDMIFRINGIRYELQGSSSNFENIPVGENIRYSVSGKLFCPNGSSCQLSGSGIINTKENTEFDIIINASQTGCRVRLQ